MQHLICIAGNVGAGKTSLTKLLAQRMGWKPLFEPVDHNPYLIEFYQDMTRWSFHSNVAFLSHHARQHSESLKTNTPTVQDRSIYEHAEIFAYNAYRQGYMTERDWNLYCTLYETFKSLLPSPELLVYLRAPISTLIKRIAQRGFSFDSVTSVEYVHQLNELYENWISRADFCKILTLNTENLDFVNNHEHLELAIINILSVLPSKSL